MAATALHRLWAILAVLGGALLVAGGIAELTVDEDADRPLSSFMAETGFLVHMRLNMAGYALVLLGLPAIGLRLARRRPAVAVAVVAWLSLGMLFMVAFSMFMGFIAPVLAREAPAMLDEDWQVPMSYLGAGFPVFFASMVAFAGVALWLGTVSRVAAGILLAGVVASAVNLPLDGVVFGGIAFAWMGLEALSKDASESLGASGH